MRKKRKRTPLTFLRFAYNETIVYQKVRRLTRKLDQNFMELGAAAYSQHNGTKDAAKKIEALSREVDALVCQINECFHEMHKKSIAIKYEMPLEKN